MVRKLLEWAVNSVFIVLLLGLVLAAVGVYAYLNVNVEAYPDPAPAIIEVVAQYPGASAEEVERQVTTPLEIALAGSACLAPWFRRGRDDQLAQEAAQAVTYEFQERDGLLLACG